MQGYRRATWLIIGLWFLSCLATLNYNGPFFDEAIYVTGGLRTLEGHGFADRYLGWFSGYLLLWPVLAALGYKVGGLIGTRIVALALATIAFASAVEATKNLFGQKASFWTAVALALNGSLLALARLGVHDVYALAGISISFYAITELASTDNRFGLVVAAVAFTLGMFAKYPMALMLFPILGVTLVLRKRKAATDVVSFGFISLALALVLFLPVREQLATLPGWRLANAPEFGVTLRMVGFGVLYWSAAPLVLASYGWFIAKDRRRLASVLWLSLALWPAYHLITGDPVSTQKHLVFGYMLAYPLAGLALSTLWGSGKHWSGIRRAATIIIVLVIATIGLVQVKQSDQAWPDSRQAAAYLVDRVQPGQKLLINESWPYTMVLYAQGRIDSPWDVVDTYRLAHDESETDPCTYDWFVDSKGSYPWAESVHRAIKRCNSFRQVFESTSTMVGLGQDLDFVSYPVSIVIWQNTADR